MNIETIIDELNDYEMTHAYDALIMGEAHNIWQDVIYGLDEIDEEATDAIDEGRNDAFVLTNGQKITYNYSTQAWQLGG